MSLSSAIDTGKDHSRPEGFTTRRRPARLWLRRLVSVSAVMCAATAVGVGGSGAALAAPAGGGGNCPKLFVLGVQGTGESSDNASPTVDSGALADVMQPLMSMAGSLVQRAYVPYNAGFGGAVPGGHDDYGKSATEGAARLGDMAKKKLATCPKTKIAVVGYSQGAHAVSMFEKSVGNGRGPISPNSVAAVAKFASPDRQRGEKTFEGTDSDRPSKVPGTKGSSVAKLPAATGQAPSGSGIGPERDVNESAGQLAGRVASFCTGGDLACDAPNNAPLMHAVTNIAGQSQLDPHDPVAALATIGESVALTTVKTAVPVINDDVQAPDNTLDSLSYQPQQSISQRLASATDPRSPLPGVDETLSAIMKVGVIGFNAVKSVVTNTFTPATIGQLATVGLANPAAALGILGTRFVGSVVNLIPPATADRWVNEAFTTLKQNVSDNKDLLNITNLLKYSQAAQMHGSYGSVPTTATGDSAHRYVAKWLAAAAFDLAGKTLNLGGASSGDLPIDTDDWFKSSDSGTSTGSSTPSTTGVPSMGIPGVGGGAGSGSGDGAGTAPPMQGSPDDGAGSGSGAGMSVDPFQTPSAPASSAPASQPSSQAGVR